MCQLQEEALKKTLQTVICKVTVFILLLFCLLRKTPSFVTFRLILHPAKSVFETVVYYTVKFPIFTGIYMHLCHSAALVWGLMKHIEKENRKLLSVTAIVCAVCSCAV